VDSKRRETADSASLRKGLAERVGSGKRVDG